MVIIWYVNQLLYLCNKKTAFVCQIEPCLKKILKSIQTYCHAQLPILNLPCLGRPAVHGCSNHECSLDLRTRNIPAVQGTSLSRRRTPERN